MKSEPLLTYVSGFGTRFRFMDCRIVVGNMDGRYTAAHLPEMAEAFDDVRMVGFFKQSHLCLWCECARARVCVRAYASMRV